MYSLEHGKPHPRHGKPHASNNVDPFSPEGIKASLAETEQSAKALLEFINKSKPQTVPTMGSLYASQSLNETKMSLLQAVTEQGGPFQTPRIATMKLIEVALENIYYYAS